MPRSPEAAARNVRRFGAMVHLDPFAVAEVEGHAEPRGERAWRVERARLAAKTAKRPSQRRAPTGCHGRSRPVLDSSARRAGLRRGACWTTQTDQAPVLEWRGAGPELGVRELGQGD